jgi:hypothetical protein
VYTFFFPRQSNTPPNRPLFSSLRKAPPHPLSDTRGYTTDFPSKHSFLFYDIKFSRLQDTQRSKVSDFPNKKPNALLLSI